MIQIVILAAHFSAHTFKSARENPLFSVILVDRKQMHKQIAFKQHITDFEMEGEGKKMDIVFRD